MATLSQAKRSECGTVHFLCLDSYRTLYDTPQPSWTLVLSTKPLYKLTGTDRRTDGRTDKPRYWEACASKKETFINMSLTPIEVTIPFITLLKD